MVTLPNIKTLFIPHKTMREVKQPEYGDDMRAIEIWARSQKAAGSAGAVEFSALFDAGASGVAVPMSGMTSTNLRTGAVQEFLPLFAGDTGYPPSAFFSGTIIDILIGGGGWYVTPASAIAYNVFGTIAVNAPNFVGPTPTIGIQVFLHVGQVLTTAGAVNGFRATSSQQNLSSGQHHQFVIADFPTTTIQGADLTFTNTPLATLRSTGGLPYIGGWGVGVVWDTRNTLTQA